MKNPRCRQFISTSSHKFVFILRKQHESCSQERLYLEISSSQIGSSEKRFQHLFLLCRRYNYRNMFLLTICCSLSLVGPVASLLQLHPPPNFLQLTAAAVPERGAVPDTTALTPPAAALTPSSSKVLLRCYHGTSHVNALLLRGTGFRASAHGFYGPGVYLTNKWSTASHYAWMKGCSPVFCLGQAAAILRVDFAVEFSRILDCSNEFSTMAHDDGKERVERVGNPLCAKNFSSPDMAARFDVIFRENQVVVRDGVLGRDGDWSATQFCHGCRPVRNLIEENLGRIRGGHLGV